MKGGYYHNRSQKSKTEIHRKLLNEVENNRKDIMLDFPVNKYFLKKNKLNLPKNMLKYKELENEFFYDVSKDNYNKVKMH
jgi:hypothetical protein